jgi:hypothetical protein
MRHVHNIQQCYTVEKIKFEEQIFIRNGGVSTELAQF